MSKEADDAFIAEREELNKQNCIAEIAEKYSIKVCNLQPDLIKLLELIEQTNRVAMNPKEAEKIRAEKGAFGIHAPYKEAKAIIYKAIVKLYVSENQDKICSECGFDVTLPRKPVFLENDVFSLIHYENDKCETCGHIRDGTTIDLESLLFKKDKEVSEKGKKMDGYFAVFNQHLNNAGDRAMKDVKEKFGVIGESKMAVLQAKGIMSLFQEKPNDVTKYYVDKVTEYVNENRV